MPSAGRERDAGCTQLLAGLPRALERPEAGATTAEAFAFKKEIHALARMARQTRAAIEWRILARHDRQQWGIPVIRLCVCRACVRRLDG